MKPVLVVPLLLLWVVLGAACLTEKEQREDTMRRCTEECASSGYKLDNVDVVVSPVGVALRVNHVICHCVKKP